MSDYDHRVEWRIAREHVLGLVTCSADAGAECRLTCPQGCEAWGPDHQDPEHPHGLVDLGHCNVVEWLDAVGVQDCYDGPDGRLRDGDIVPDWTGDEYTWEYADDDEQVGAE